jgi:hypothetical protein
MRNNTINIDIRAVRTPTGAVRCTSVYNGLVISYTFVGYNIELARDMFRRKLLSLKYFSPHGETYFN